MSDEDPIKILQIRFAKGEISEKQYEQMLSFLSRDISSFKPESKEIVTTQELSVKPVISPVEENAEPYWILRKKI